MKKLLALVLLSFSLCACLPTVAGVAVYKAAQNKTQNNYRQYKADMEKTNQERKDKGLEPMPIKSFEEWKATK